jgi:hypothetical protein
VAFEKHRIRLRMAAGAWRDYHEPIHARLPFVHSCTVDAAVQEDLRRADERQERTARNLVQSFTFGVWCVRGGGRAPPRTKLAALRSGVPTFSGLRDLGRGARTTQKARRSSAGALLNISPPRECGTSRNAPLPGRYVKKAAQTRLPSASRPDGAPRGRKCLYA